MFIFMNRVHSCLTGLNPATKAGHEKPNSMQANVGKVPGSAATLQFDSQPIEAAGRGVADCWRINLTD
jgi:hypothetical protein